jgi:hypothetical protein
VGDDRHLALRARADRGRRDLAESRVGQFPRAEVGKSCVRFKRLDDLDETALHDLLRDAGRLPAPGAVG